MDPRIPGAAEYVCGNILLLRVIVEQGRYLRCTMIDSASLCIDFWLCLTQIDAAPIADIHLRGVSHVSYILCSHSTQSSSLNQLLYHFCRVNSFLYFGLELLYEFICLFLAPFKPCCH